MKRLLALLALLPLLGCEVPPARTAIDRDTLTQRQKDSITATLPLPGAGGVGRALRAADQAKARAEAHDRLLSQER